MGNTTTTTGDLKFLIASRLDVTEILDILGWNEFDLVEALEDYINEKHDDFLEAVG